MLRIIFYIILVSYLFTGCSDNDNHSNEHLQDDHDHEEAVESYTVYSENFELFVEFNSLIVNKESEFISHFTYLNNFKPMLSGKLSVELIISNSKVKTNINEIYSKGIFRPKLRPEFAGKGKLIFTVSDRKISESIVLENITVYKDCESALQNYHETDVIGGISFLKEQSWSIDFETLPVLVKPFSEVIKTSGEVFSAQGDEMIISAKSSGNFCFNKTKLTLGKYIKKGEVIGYIADNNLSENNTSQKYINSKVLFEKSEKDFQRANELFKDSIISEKEYLEYKLNFEQAEYAYNQVSENYASLGTQVVSTNSGYLKEIYISEGQYLEVGNPIVKLSQNRKLNIRADVSQKYTENLEHIISANFKTPNANNVYNTIDLNGKILSFGKSTSNGYMLPIYFEIDYVDNLIPGSFIEVWLKTSLKDDAVLVPTQAIIEEQGTYSVFKQLNGETFKKQDIKIGSSDGKYTEILSGLSGEERVVTKGATRIKLASMSKALPDHGHAH
ncbi:efflux RND transporter periplasmic adaptor subunit [Bacteroidota bacterium]